MPGVYRATWLAMPRPMNPAPNIANRTGPPAAARARNAASTMITGSPDLPRRGALSPVLLQHLLVAQRIHRLPEPPVPVGGELPITSEPAQRLPLPDALIALDVIDRRWLEDEESAVDPRPVAGGLLVELVDSCLAVRDGDDAEAPRRLNRRHRRQAPFAPVEGDQLGDVDVAHAVAVGEAEGLVPDQLAHPPQAAARHRAVAGIDERHTPGLELLRPHVDVVPPQIERHIRAPQTVAGEILLDEDPLVPAADDEVVDAVRIEDLHDVPQDRVLADLDHRLRPHLRLFGQPGPEAPRQDDRLHIMLPSPRRSTNSGPSRKPP